MEASVQLSNLLSYTLFHIGVYISLVTALIGAGVFAELNHPVFRFSVFCFLVAGICGAAVRSNIPEYATWVSFSQAKLGFWGCGFFSYSSWTTAEHIAFWLGILPLALLFVARGAAGFKWP